MNRRQLVIAAALTTLTVVVFSDVRHHSFVNYDDGAYVTENSHVNTGLTWANVKWAFSFESCEATSNWHPLTWLSLMADVSVFGVSSFWLHLMNLVLHIANVILLFLILDSLTHNLGASAFVAAVFAVHPLHVESVAWVSERKDVLSTLLVLLTIAAHLRFVREKHTTWQLISLMLFVLSLLTKQMYVTLPFLLLLLDYWPLKRMVAADETIASGRWLQPRKLLTEKLWFLVIAVAFSVIAFAGQKHGGSVGSLEQFPVIDRCLNAVVSYALYLWQTVWPSGLAVFYPYPQDSQWVQAIVAGGALLCITGGGVLLRSRQPWLIVGWLWYLGTLTPVIGIVQIGRQRMADRYMYFPMIGLLIGITWALSSWATGHPGRQTHLRRIALLVIVVLAWAGRVQTSYWKDSQTLFSHAAKVAESSLAYTKLGYERGQLREFDAATNLFHRALRLDPNYVAAHSSLGNTCLAEGQPHEALSHFLKTIELEPDHMEAHYNLGLVYTGLGQLPQAVKHYTRALQIREDDANVHTNLGTTYLMLKQNALALQHLQRALEIDPTLPEAHFTLGSFLMSAKRDSEAIQHFQQGLQKRPDSVEVHEKLALLFLNQGDSERADAHQKRADAARVVRESEESVP